MTNVREYKHDVWEWVKVMTCTYIYLTIKSAPEQILIAQDVDASRFQYVLPEQYDGTRARPIYVVSLELYIDLVWEPI